MTNRPESLDGSQAATGPTMLAVGVKKWMQVVSLSSCSHLGTCFRSEIVSSDEVAVVERGNPDGKRLTIWIAMFGALI